ncbi:MAG TPA: hypothetical protein DC049_03040, partial [Spirochaetia bacterium]|nr:hypothetical protein [Spirochaetia bacterium]
MILIGARNGKNTNSANKAINPGRKNMLKKVNQSILASTSCVLVMIFQLCCAEKIKGCYELLDLNSGKKNYSIYGNASVELIANDDNGKTEPCLKIKIGGLNTEKSGGFQITAMPYREFWSKSGCDRISFDFKGDGGTGTFVIIITLDDNSTWCWNGKRWDISAQISITDKIWRKAVYQFTHFKPATSKSVESILEPGKIKNIFWGIGNQLKDGSIKLGTFYLKNIKIESADGMIYKTSLRSTDDSISPVSSQKFLPDWNSSAHYNEKTVSREKICLNAHWKFCPVTDSLVSTALDKQGLLPALPNKMPDTPDWGFVKVPGRWDGRMYYVLNADGEIISNWNNTPLCDYMQAWLKRSIYIPPEWKDKKKIFVTFDLISKKAVLFVNGKNAGAVFGISGKFDISHLLFFGQTNEIALAMECPPLPLKTSDRQRYKDFTRKGMGASWWYKNHEGPGIAGNVWLEILPEEIQLENPVVLTSVRQNKIFLETAIKNRLNFRKNIRLQAQIYSKKKLVKEINSQDIEIGANEKLRHSISADWNDPIYWSPENPHLYTMLLSVAADEKILDEISQDFGFRELEIRGSSFFLNGNKIRLKFSSYQYEYSSLPDSSLIELLTEIKKMNFNG